MQKLLHTLTELVVSARRLALEAEAELRAGRKEGYRRALERRTDLLRRLPELVAADIEGLPSALIDSVRATVSEISSEAAESRRIGSLWYMGILLVGEENDPKAPNELDRLIALLAAAAER